MSVMDKETRSAATILYNRLKAASAMLAALEDMRSYFFDGHAIHTKAELRAKVHAAIIAAKEAGIT